ncbi:right-handed parallel beta-helix repeat-containing protein [Paenibacillus sp. GCM10023252]|uniref:right-handed parallel beta-helix repeat-containing protein n=1 Tax=Paenibacillus sp. GCM10023252 TaxID=3252649 RepID=UPI0036137A51
MLRKMFGLVVLAAVMILVLSFPYSHAPAAYAAGTIYYVDSVNGNDGFSGTSQTAAWKTLSKVNATTFQPGDQILFKAGGMWTGKLSPKGSGVSGSPIVINQYGSGNKPIINGGGLINTGAVHLYNQQYWEIYNLEITNKGTLAGQKMGVSIEAKDIGTLNHIYLKNLVIHDVNGLQTDKQNGGIWVHTFGNQVQSKFNDIQIMNNTVYNTDRAGIVVTSDWWCNPDVVTCGATRPAYYPSTNVVVSHNYVYSLGGDGISIRDTTSPLVEYNVVHDANARSGTHNNAIWTYNATNAIVQYNEAYLTRTTKDGHGFGLDYLQTGAVFQYNYSHDNEGGFAAVYSDGSWAPQSNKNSVIRYNISQNDKTRIFSWYGPTTDTLVYNNTVYNSNKRVKVLDLINWSGYAKNITLSNNIIYNTGSMSYAISNGTNLNFKNNNFFGVTPPSGSNVTITGTTTVDPKLVSPGTGAIGRTTVDGYKLQPTSPLIHAGVVIANNGGQDYWGTPVSSTNNPNIGAFNGYNP